MSATNAYLGPSNSGTVDGSSCANARIASYFNSSANWGAGSTQIGAGTTVHLCGSIPISLSVPASSNGTITVIWETGAKLSQAAAASFVATGAFTNNWIFDGGFPCGTLPTGLVSCNGVVENTANGTNLANQVSQSWAFNINNTLGTVVIKNLEIRNIYVHAPPVTLTGCSSLGGSATVTCTCSGNCGFSAGQQGISVGSTSNSAYNNLNHNIVVSSTSGSTIVLTYPATVAAGSSTGGIIGEEFINDGHCCGPNAVWTDFQQNNLTIQDCTIHDMGWAIFPNIRSAVGARVEIARNNIYNINHAFAMGTVIGAPSYSISFHDNWVHDFFSWDNVSNRYHHDGIHIFSNKLDISNMWIYNNKWGGGTKDLYENVTAYLFLQGIPSNTTVYNNILICNSSTCKNPFLVKQGGGPNSRWLNNTFMGTGVAVSNTDPFLNVTGVGLTNAGSNESFINNIVDGAAPLVDFESGTFAAATTTAGLHHNLYSNLTSCTPIGNGCWIWTGPVRTASFTTWKSVSGEGASSIAASSAGLDANGNLVSVSPATGAGANLTSLCSESADMAALCFESTFGNTKTPAARPAVAAWDIGADQFSAGSPAVPIVSLSPVSLSFGSQTVGTTSGSQVIALQNIGTATLNISNIFIGGTNPGDFNLTNGCGATLAASGSCNLTVTFSPTVVGARTANITINDNASGSPHTAGLSGTGGAAVPLASAAPLSLNFSNINVGSTSASQSISLVNNGTATLTISSIAISGVNAADFSQNNNCGGSVLVGNGCQINVSFSPSVLGARSAAVTITDNDANSPQVISLAGTGGSVVLSEIIFNDSALGATVDAIKASAATVYYMTVDNSLGGVPVYVKFFNLAAGNVSLGTTVPDEILYVPANSRLEHLFFSDSLFGKVFPTALSAACVTAGGTGGATAPSNKVSVTLAYS